MDNDKGDIALIAQCLGARHHDGFVREECLRRILAASEDWTVPFVVQLLGEYVIEIIQSIQDRFSRGVESRYVEFFQENAEYCERLEYRAISYWNEYYRWRFPRYEEFPAVAALTLLKAASKGRAQLMR